MATFEKTILRVGTYRSPDGVVRVTPDRLRHWEAEFNRMKRARQQVPMHFDHGTTVDQMKPIDLDAPRPRSAANTVGIMESFRVTPDGRSANIRFRTVVPSATQRVRNNVVFVSPVIFPEFNDGKGNRYRDAITHMDLVDYPVDSTQSPARVVACSAFRMGLGPELYRFSSEDKPVEDDKLDDVAVDEMEPEADDLPPAIEPEPEPTGPEIGDLMLALADHGVVLPEDTTDANFLDRLRTALIAKKGTDSSGGGDLDDEGDQFDQTGDTIVADPQIATMSAFANNAYRKELAGQLDTLLKTGRCTPGEYEEQRAAMRAVRLSLDEHGAPRNNTVSQWIDSRSTLPRAACWTSREKLRRMNITVAEHPEPRLVQRDRNNEVSDDAVRQFLKR